MLFSVIVPVYKVEKYLPQCIESVLNQSFKDFELILIDDGSPDNSGVICDEYAKKDNRIRVLHKKNGGLSDARNKGLTIAKGEFIWFLDSDDYMAEAAMDNVANTIINNRDLDMITCAHINLYIDGKKTVASLPYNYSNINREEFLYNLYKSNGAYWAAWKNIYKNSIIKKYNLKFLNGLIGAEDCDFFMQFSRSAERFGFLNVPVIYYRINREGSITNNMSKKAIIGQLEVFKDNYDLYKNISEEMKVFFANKFANTISLLYHLKSEVDIVEVSNFIKENKKILKDTKGLKYNVAKLIWGIFSYYKGSKIIRSINYKKRYKYSTYRRVL